MCDKEFAKNAKAAGETILVGGSNYGQGSSREHAALVPLYLGVRAVIAKSFARIHAANLINAGILPLTFADPDDYDALTQGETLTLTGHRRRPGQRHHDAFTLETVKSPSAAASPSGRRQCSGQAVC